MVHTGSQLLDTILALAFVYFLLALICSGIREIGSAVVRTRARFLKKAIRQILTKQTADSVLDHPLITTTAPGRHSVPSYVSSRTFALALFDTLAPGKGRDDNYDVIEAMRGELANLPDPVQRQIRPLLDDAARRPRALPDWNRALV